MGRKRLFNDKEKWCNKCTKWLPLDAFGENKRTASGKSHYCKTCHNTYCGTFWTKVKSYERLLEAKFRMTPGEYLDLWRSQNKLCAICDHSLVLYHRETHVHVFGEVKRLLCGECDKGMEFFRDDAGLLEKAAQLMGQPHDEGKDNKTSRHASAADHH